MGRKRLLLGLVVVLAIAILSLGLVGSAAAAEEKKPIIVGTILPLTGPYAGTAQANLKCMKLAIHEQNEKGGLLGRKLVLKVADTRGGEAENVYAAGERLIKEGCDAVITGYCTLGPADGHMFGKYEIPYIAMTAITALSDAIRDNLPEYDNVFMAGWSEMVYGWGLQDETFGIPAKMGWTPPNKKIAVFKADLPYCIEPPSYFAEWAKTLGYEIVIDEISPFGKADWSDAMTKLERKKPAFIIQSLLSPQDAAKWQIAFYDRFYKKGYNGIIISQYSPSSLEYQELTTPEQREGVIAMGATMRTHLPVVVDYMNRWEAFFGEPLDDVYAILTRDNFEQWVRAVEMAGSVDDYALVCKYIRQTPHVGMWGTVVYQPLNQTAIYGENLLPLDFIQFHEEGVMVNVAPKAVANGVYEKPALMETALANQ